MQALMMLYPTLSLSMSFTLASVHCYVAAEWRSVKVMLLILFIAILL